MDIVADTSVIIAVIADEPEKAALIAHSQGADGKTFVLTPETGQRSPLDVAGVDLGVSTAEIVNLIRESRERL